jgi:catechol 2,3-dioxygenase-like lactoylglutathione lyase family enzyme
MVKTFGLTHISLAVADPERSLKFYGAVFGMKAVYQDDDGIQASTPGCSDVVAFEKNAERAGKRAGADHFGFRLTKPSDIDAAVKAVEKAGGRLLRRGEFGPGQPYAFVEDPDGYEIEIWFE